MLAAGCVTKPKSIKSRNASGTSNKVAEPSVSNTKANKTLARYGRKNGHKLDREYNFFVGGDAVEWVVGCINFYH